MNNEIKLNEIIVCTIVIFTIFILIEIFVVPDIEIRLNILSKVSQKIKSSQNISPARLYVNVWRTVKNSYVDKSMNNQNWNRWRYRYLKEIKTVKDAEIAINTMLLSLNDPYGKFLCSDLFAKHKTVLESKITGVGIMFNKSGDDVVINHVLDNSPAQAANIQAGDTIISIDGKKANSEDIDVLINKIEDTKKDTVEIILKHNDTIVTKKLQKQDIPVKTMNYEITEDNIGIITLSNIMGKKAIEDFKDIIVKTNDTKAIIIDLRNNYGGILANAIVMVNYMIDEEKILSIKSRINKEYKIYSDGEKIFKQKPIIILMNKKTASAAEILAGVLRVRSGAILLGENSFGKNSIQHVIPMQNSSGLIITTDKYILPEETDISGIGLIPDIYIKQSSKKQNDEQMELALKLIKDKSYNEN